MIGGSPKILLVRLSALGDCLHAIPSLVALRRQFPNAEIGWAIEELSYSLLKDHPMVDRFHVFPRKAFKRGSGTLMSRMRSLSAFRKELGAVGYDSAVDLQGLAKSGLVSWWSGAKQRIGFKGADSRELNRVFTTARIEPPEEAVHVVEKNLSLLKPLGVDLPSKPEWVMPAYDAEKLALQPFLKECGLLDECGHVRDFAIINPGATWFTKRWPPELFGEVAKGLREKLNLPSIVTWAGADELAASKTIVTIGCGGAGGGNVFLAPDTDLRSLAALTAQAALFVGNDTGPLHLAVALKINTVAIFGATDPLRNGPYGSGHRIQTGGVECHPCWKTSCERQDRACLTWVKPETVLVSCEHSLRRRARSENGSAAAC